MSTSNVLTVKIEADPNSVGGGAGTSGRPGDPMTPWEQRATSGLIEQRRKAFEQIRKTEEQAESKRLKDILEGQKILADLRARRQKAEEDEEKRRLESSARRAADVHQQRADWEKQQGGLPGFLSRFMPGGLGNAFKQFGGSKAPQFVGKDVQAAEGTQLAKAVPEAAGGLGGAAMAAAGPVGAALAIAEVSARAAASGLNTLRGSVDKFGQSMKRLANDDVAGQFEDMTESFASGLEKMPINGQVQAAFVRAVAEPFKQFKQMVDVYADRGRALSGYSGAASSASANADTAKILADLREGQQMGEGYARLIESQSKLETTVRDALLPIKSAGVDTLGVVLSAVAADVSTTAKIGEQFFAAFMEFIPPYAKDAAKAAIAEVKRRADEANAEARNEMIASAMFELNDLYDAFHRGVPDPGIAAPSPTGATFTGVIAGPIGQP